MSKYYDGNHVDNYSQGKARLNLLSTFSAAELSLHPITAAEYSCLEAGTVRTAAPTTRKTSPMLQGEE